MSSVLITPPAAEPVTLADAKAYLRVAHSDDDAVIAALIAGARSHVEAQTRRALITQTWRLIRDGWPPDGRIAVTPVPLRSVVAARVYDSGGATHAIDTSAFAADKAAAPAVLAFAPWTLTEPANVPESLRQALLLLVAHWYENRGLIAVGQSVAVLPMTVAALIAPYRVLSL
jgi:uncharacterized phiE125 gp8 family phage protein